MGAASTSTAHETSVSKSSSTRVIREMLISGWLAILRQTSETTVETWNGISGTDAVSLCTSSETSTLSGTTRNYLGGAEVRSSSGAVYAWMRCDACWGTQVVSQMSKIGDTDLYNVTKTTTVLDVSAPGAYLVKY